MITPDYASGADETIESIQFWKHQFWAGTKRKCPAAFAALRERDINDDFRDLDLKEQATEREIHLLREHYNYTSKYS